MKRYTYEVDYDFGEPCAVMEETKEGGYYKVSDVHDLLRIMLDNYTVNSDVSSKVYDSVKSMLEEE